jgi:ABC-type Fe3+-hydroxamate transport system substrate-binding protein
LSIAYCLFSIVSFTSSFYTPYLPAGRQVPCSIFFSSLFIAFLSCIMPIFIDQLGRPVVLDKEPLRIISLVPSQTELLYDLGLNDEVIGITQFCVHPETWYRSKTRIGGTKKLDLEKIKALKPDLIIANKEENLKNEIELLSGDFPVWTSDVRKLEDALEMIVSIGEITNTVSRADEIQKKIRENFTRLNPLESRPRTAYMVWRKPYMAAGQDTFINDMLGYAGFQNICSNLMPRYPYFQPSDFETLNCEILLLSSEPFPFTEKHVKEFQSFFPDMQIHLVDGEMFSWYGSRLIKAPAYFEQLRLRVYL